MKRVMKWLLLPVLMAAVLTVALPQQAEAHVRARVGYPGYYVGYRPYYAGHYWGGGAVWVPPIRVVRPAVVVPRVVVPAPVIPYAPNYQVWE